MAMKLKTVTIEDKTYAEVLDDKPVYVADDGKDVAFDAVHSVTTIARLNGESKGQREAREAAEAKLKLFEGIEDPEVARKAMETVKNIKDGELISAGKAEEIKAAARQAAEERVAEAQKVAKTQLDEAAKTTETLTRQLFSEKIGGAFARSKFISEKTILPGPAAEKIFGDAFKIEDGKVVAYGPDGNKVYSRTTPGDLAGFEEAVEMLVDIYPFRDNILKGTGGGTGSRGGNGGARDGSKTILRADFERLDPRGKMAKMSEGIQVVDA